jgi:hypothetical protein
MNRPPAPLLHAVEFVSYADAIGYGQAASAYVQALVDAGVAVHWKPYLSADLWAGRTGPAHDAAALQRGRAAVAARGVGPGLNALQALVEATAKVLPADVRVVHTLPRFWPALVPPTDHRDGVPQVGMTVWETDRLSPEWLPALGRVDRLVVPCTHNAVVLDAARQAGAAVPPVEVVPHVCRAAFRPPPPARLAGLAQWLGLRAGDTVFYSINAWDPRKRLGALIEAYARAFNASEPVLLVVKTNKTAWFDDPLAAAPGDRDVARMVAAIRTRVAAECGREGGRVALIADDEVADSVIDGLHELGHAFVSWSRCEGFGLGSFDAAARARPVLAVGYGGPVDYLGSDWPGRIHHSMVACAAIPGFGWFDAQQQWPEPDDAQALALMRAFVQAPAALRAHASHLQTRIAQDFCGPAVAARLCAALQRARPANTD